MEDKLINNSNVDGKPMSDSSTRNTLRERGRSSGGSSSWVKWIVWSIVAVLLALVLWWLFSPAPSTSSVEWFSFSPTGSSKSSSKNKIYVKFKEGKDVYQIVSNSQGYIAYQDAPTDIVYRMNVVRSNINGTPIGNPFGIYFSVKGHYLTKTITHTNTNISGYVYQFNAASKNSLCFNDSDGIVFIGSWGDLDSKGSSISDSLYNGNLEWVSGLNNPDYTVPNSSRAYFMNFLLSFGPLIVIFILFYYMARKARSLDGDGESLFTIGKSLAKLAKTKVKFTDVAGIAEEKQELIEVVDYLKRPGKYAAMGARIPRGVILYGPPGTGKTLLAKAVAGEAQVPFFQIAGSAFEDMLVGVGAKRVRDLFNKARKVAPCIIFIDEIDSVGSKRGRSEVVGGSYSISEQTINQLLGEMDGFETKTGIIVIAATNRIDVLDEALLRPGRFDRHIKISLPDIREREDILKLHAKNKNFSSKVNFADIARRTPGFSGAQLENTLNEAVLLAVRNNRTVILESDIDEAIDRVIAGPAKLSRTMTDSERNQIAYHEAGHALTGLYLKSGEEVQKITIIPRGNAGGYTLSAPKGYETDLKRKSDLLNMIAVCLGGRASEEIIFGSENISTGASDDLYKATNIVRNMVMQLGMSSLGKTQYVPSQGTLNPNSIKLYSDETALEIDKEIDKILNQEYKRASDVISNNIDELKLIVEALLAVETIVKKDINFIHENKRLPDEIIAAKKKIADDLSKNKTNSNVTSTVSDKSKHEKFR